MNIERVLSASDPGFEGLLRIYAEALPPSECKSPDALRSMIARPEYFFLAAIDESGVIGFSIAIALADSDAALLEYIAVDAAHRGSGIGSALFRATVEHPAFCTRLVLGEVESDTAGHGDAEIRARRKHFYRQLGARQIEGLVYIMPPVNTSLPPPMDLFLCGSRQPPTVAKSRVRAWLAACYAQVYGLPPGDSRIDMMLDGLPQTIHLI
jgi:GNAT superfamily N-acetyltransferase